MCFLIRMTRNSFYNTGLKATPESMAIINETLIDLANSMLPRVDCVVGAAVQPITEHLLQAARDNGGDAIDLDPADGRFIGKPCIPGNANTSPG